MKKLTKTQINKLKKEFGKRITNRTAFCLDMAKLASELSIIDLKYGKFAVYIAVKEAYNAWDLAEMDKQVGDELKHLSPHSKKEEVG